ncbi:NAD(P)-dependent oxidoreductase [Planomonospora sp. ID67723]|uniref:NAD(P)-dependent oxidoreductase n=1 Tax=Planomonospora sp. ID67723 TaxID=2738134 RepID=UPI0018C3EB76|nr:NAD(P)-binding domain-containing protein [Planomonospora sp. ID67723]MBG0830088.1 NAD(P)-dependent oxidoreductase [Planomonospora sp. ID67723]
MTEIENSTPRVTVIGTGAIGSAVVRRLLAGGRDVVVWNRTASRSARLVEEGALPAGSIREAISSSPLVLLTLTDHAAVRQCLAALDTDLSGRTIVAMCTGTADDARSAAQRVAALGARYLDAGIQASPDMIGTDAATILYSGHRSAFEQHAAALGLLSRPRFVGEAPEAAAIWDLALFGVWYDAQLGLLRALETVREAGIDVAEFSRTAGLQLGHVVEAVPGTVSELLRADYPAGPAGLTEHLAVIRHLVVLRSGRRLGDGGLPEVAARIEALIADGRGGEGLTATIG